MPGRVSARHKWIHQRLRELVGGITVLRDYWKEYPAMRKVERMEDGTLKLTAVIDPEYADRAAVLLCPSRYQWNLLVLTRALDRFNEGEARGEMVPTTTRAEEYAHQNLDGFDPNSTADKQKLKRALEEAAIIVHPDFKPHDILVDDALEGTAIAADAHIRILAKNGGRLRFSAKLSLSYLSALDYDMGDKIQVVFYGKPPAGIVVVENHALANAAVGWDVAKANNVVLIGLHGRVKYKESYLVWILSLLRELKDLPVLILTDLDIGGINIEKVLRNGRWNARMYVVRRARRVGLTALQLQQDCDGTLKRSVSKKSRTEAENMVRRAKRAKYAKEFDDATLDDARYIWKTGTGAHAESIQFPSATAGHAAGLAGQGSYLKELVAQQLQRAAVEAAAKMAAAAAATAAAVTAAGVDT